MKYFVTEKISDNMRKTPEGFLLCLSVPIARTGIQEYGPDEVPIECEDGQLIKVQRDASEVFRPETIASFEGKPITIGHPDEMVNSSNWKELAKGTMQNVRRGEGQYNDSLIADILITDESAIKEVEAGLREVSCGYEADYVQTGVGNGRQTNIIGNHLALVPEGRAGSSYAIKDHKGDTMSLKDKLSKLFDTAGIGGKIKEDALKAVATVDAKTDGVGTEVQSDAAPKWAQDLKASMDALMAGQKPAADATPAPAAAAAPAADADPMKKCMDMLDAIGKRLDALEGKGKDAEFEAEDEENEETGDEEGEETDDEEMDDEENMVGDAKARVEILAPGKKFTGKDAAAKALAEAYSTKDGKEVIDILTGGKKPNLKHQKTVDSLFVKASDVLRIKRSGSFPGSKGRVKVRDGHAENDGKVMSAEDINKKNEEFYAKQGSH